MRFWVAQKRGKLMTAKGRRGAWLGAGTLDSILPTLNTPFSLIFLR